VSTGASKERGFSKLSTAQRLSPRPSIAVLTRSLISPVSESPSDPAATLINPHLSVQTRPSWYAHLSLFAPPHRLLRLSSAEHVVHVSVAVPSRLRVACRQAQWNRHQLETSNKTMAATHHLFPGRHTTLPHVPLSDTAAFNSLLLAPLLLSTPLPRLALPLPAPLLPEPLAVPQLPSAERQLPTVPTAPPMSDPAALVPQVPVVAAVPC
jgi:hypothetical protein